MYTALGLVDDLAQLTAAQLQALQNMGVIAKLDASGQPIFVSPKTGQPYTQDQLNALLASGGQPVKAILGQPAAVAPGAAAPATAAPTPGVMPVETPGAPAWVLPVAIGGGIAVAGAVVLVMILRARRKKK